jgi:N-acetylmuramic acid 6-phosphate etherase
MSITESTSLYNTLEKKNVSTLLREINIEDQKVAKAVGKCLPGIEKLVNAILEKMVVGGRLFYIGAGTSGRLGILDASECPPTFGVEHGLVVGLIAGGDGAIRKAVEFAEDDPGQAWRDLQVHHISQSDFVVGLAASGRTPYVLGGLKDAQEKGLKTGLISCNPDSPASNHADFAIEINVGPEYLTGSTRMKSGTAQKLVLNMITTSLMIKLGRVKGNKMVDMQLSNSKLLDRGTRFIMEELNLDEKKAMALLKKAGSVRKALEISENA